MSEKYTDGEGVRCALGHLNYEMMEDVTDAQ
jgi:hypothetical protein